MQYRWPVGRGPSSKTCPRCEPHDAHVTSIRWMKWLESSWSSTASDEAGSQKLGHPVPESYFSFERNSWVPQAAQRYTPCSCSSQYPPVKARSVPFSRSTWYGSGESCSRHSASDFWILAGISSPSQAFSTSTSRNVTGSEVVPRTLGRLPFGSTACSDPRP